MAGRLSAHMCVQELNSNRSMLRPSVKDTCFFFFILFFYQKNQPCVSEVIIYHRKDRGCGLMCSGVTLRGFKLRILITILMHSTVQLQGVSSILHYILAICTSVTACVRAEHVRETVTVVAAQNQKKACNKFS